ncbi:MAG: hypothetical protein FJX25_09850 [Alphaproteobacteria bacterium]|nr:hypothetical protein [Alphaproteobacteria bacterium]
MTPHARAFLHSPVSRPASYRPAGGGAEVACRVVINDVPGEVRREGGEQYYSDNAQLVVSKAVPVSAKGIFVVAGSTYHIVAVEPCPLPGLMECEVYRKSGAGVGIHDLSGPILASSVVEPVVINGRVHRAIVSRKAETLEVDDSGTEAIVQRNRVAIREKDAAGIEAGSVVQFDGQSFRVLTQPRRTGAGMLTLIC